MINVHGRYFLPSSFETLSFHIRPLSQGETVTCCHFGHWRRAGCQLVSVSVCGRLQRSARRLTAHQPRSAAQKRVRPPVQGVQTQTHNWAQRPGQWRDLRTWSDIVHQSICHHGDKVSFKALNEDKNYRTNVISTKKNLKCDQSHT